MSKFAKQVYLLAAKVPAGKVATYKSVAIAAGNPKAFRAVGCLMSKNNPKITKVACHRIVKSDGSLGGFSAKGGKAKLLAREGVHLNRGKIDLRHHLYKF